MGDRLLRERALAWIQHDPDPESRASIAHWLEQGDTASLHDAFGPQLRFGTAGIRGPMGPGASRLNRATVRRCIAAMCSYLHALDPTTAERGLCIGFDGRRHSQTFAQDAAAVAIEAGFRVRRYETPVATPVLAHATKRHAAAAGVMITASHNPPGDNGIKVFWQGGGQIVSPHDAAIADAMQALARTPTLDESSLSQALRLDESDTEAYLDALMGALPAAPTDVPTPSATYSALGGVGAAITRRTFARLGMAGVHEVAEECVVDPDFAGLHSPNPEHAGALARSLAASERSPSDLVFIHDPDADRLRVGVRAGTDLVMLNGDELGCLLADYCLEQPSSQRPAVLTTLVSSGMLERIAAAHGALYRCVPTGFKWITSAGRALERDEDARYVFGYEEAIGYGLPSLGDDKDGIAALALTVRLWQAAHEQGQTLLERLHALYADHGAHRTGQLSWSWPQPGERERVMERLRKDPPQRLAGKDRTVAEADPRAPQLLLWRFGPALRVALRPSGTEPKLKAYLEACTPAGSAAQVQCSLADADQLLALATEELRELVR